MGDNRRMVDEVKEVWRHMMAKVKGKRGNCGFVCGMGEREG